MLCKIRFLTEDLDSNDVLSFAVAVFSHQLVVALVLSDGFWDGNLRPQSCPGHLKMRKVWLLLVFSIKQT